MFSSSSGTGERQKTAGAAVCSFKLPRSGVGGKRMAVMRQKASLDSGRTWGGPAVMPGAGHKAFTRNVTTKRAHTEHGCRFPWRGPEMPQTGFLWREETGRGEDDEDHGSGREEAWGKRMLFRSCPQVVGHAAGDGRIVACRGVEGEAQSDALRKLRRP